MKGQFFIIGALLVCVLLYLGVGPLIALTGSPAGDMGSIAGNLAGELPHALNVGMNASDPAGTLQNFTEFSADALLARGIELSCLWVAFVPDGSGINATAGNSMGSEETVGINASGTYHALQVPDGSYNSTSLTVQGYSFNATVTLEGEARELLLLANKTSLYAVVTLSRGDDVIRKEILA